MYYEICHCIITFSAYINQSNSVIKDYGYCFPLHISSLFLPFSSFLPFHPKPSSTTLNNIDFKFLNEKRFLTIFLFPQLFKKHSRNAVIKFRDPDLVIGAPKPHRVVRVVGYL